PRPGLPLAGYRLDRAWRLDRGEPRPGLLPAAWVFRPPVDRGVIRRAHRPDAVKALTAPDLVLLAAVRDDRLVRHDPASTLSPSSLTRQTIGTGSGSSLKRASRQPRRSGLWTACHPHHQALTSATA